MPVTRLLAGAAFDPATFEAALQKAGIDRTDTRADAIARKIIEGASLGERDPARLRELGEAALGRRMS